MLAKDHAGTLLTFMPAYSLIDWVCVDFNHKGHEELQESIQAL